MLGGNPSTLDTLQIKRAAEMSLPVFETMKYFCGKSGAGLEGARRKTYLLNWTYPLRGFSPLARSST